jgi:hypothetical protein
MHGRKADHKDTPKFARLRSQVSFYDRGTVTRLSPGKPAKIATKISSIHSDIGSVIHDVRSVSCDIRRTAESPIPTKLSEILPQIDPVASEISEIGSDARARESIGRARESAGKARSAECPRESHSAHERAAKGACKTRGRAHSSRKTAPETHSAAKPSVKSAAEPHPTAEPGSTAKGCGAMCDHERTEGHGDRSKSADRLRRHSVPPLTMANSLYLTDRR